MINWRLAESMGISVTAIEEIEYLQDSRELLVHRMKNLPSDHVAQVRLLEVWRENETKLQKLWGCEPNSDFWREFNLPHCTCPKMDNEELVGTPKRLSLSGCPVHSIGVLNETISTITTQL